MVTVAVAVGDHAGRFAVDLRDEAGLGGGVDELAASQGHHCGPAPAVFQHLGHHVEIMRLDGSYGERHDHHYVTYAMGDI
ncbi:hypothetical protein [Nonomuraea sp. SYSU D8015]|uniref:hypothetical protein n=1 Tax=Nonomuraea sp. SYSU D8015 TaxID=2593644 RepID=UPI00166031EE|nr:hypothetical protein [Nonomuraea sp. SYSU D8015]